MACTTTPARDLYIDALYDYLCGSSSGRISADARFRIYVLCDGFGLHSDPVAAASLREYFDGGCDWSHVRDSSDAALRAAGLQLQQEVRAA